MAEQSNGQSRVALITGASVGGSGLAAALALVEQGWTVYAGARKPERLAHLETRNLHILPLDVTDEASMTNAVRTIEATHGAVDALVNNAAYGEMGAIESVPLEQVRQQFETNVFGLIRMTQLVLPGMRRKGWGRVVNISSMGGEFTTPFAGLYHATKYAVESISDALRMEVLPFGIEVVVVQPGGINTPLGQQTIQAIPQNTNDAYAPYLHAFGQVSAAAGQMPETMVTPEQVAQIIVEAITAEHPLTRYKVNTSDMQTINQERNSADRQKDAAMRQQLGLANVQPAGATGN